MMKTKWIVLCLALACTFAGAAWADETAAVAESAAPAVCSEAAAIAPAPEPTASAENVPAPAGLDAEGVETLLVAPFAFDELGTKVEALTGWWPTKICPVDCSPCNTAADCEWGGCKALNYCP